MWTLFTEHSQRCSTSNKQTNKNLAKSIDLSPSAEANVSLVPRSLLFVC
jgi:hypothetical protein